YLRAGLLGTVSAGTGETLLYLAPGADSLAAAWARIVEPLVRPTDSLPAALRSQLPYPRQAFRIAAALLAPPRPDSPAWQPRPRDRWQSRPTRLDRPGIRDRHAARVRRAHGRHDRTAGAGAVRVAPQPGGAPAEPAGGLAPAAHGPRRAAVVERGWGPVVGAG